MAENNGRGERHHAMRKDGQSWTGVAQEVKAIQEDIRALVANSRQRLLRAVDEEMRRMLGEAMAWLAETSEPELLPQSPETRETPPLEVARENLYRGGDQSNPPQGISEQAPVSDGHINTGEDRQAGAPLNSMETLAELVASQEGTRSHTGTRNEMEAHEAVSSEVASSGSIPGSEETYAGVVQIAVPVGQSSSQALRFVDELSRHPSLRLQRLLGSLNGRMDLWVLVQDPMALKEELLEMEGVSQVDTVPAQGRKDAGAFLEVRLKKSEAVYDS